MTSHFMISENISSTNRFQCKLVLVLSPSTKLYETEITMNILASIKAIGEGHAEKRSLEIDISNLSLNYGVMKRNNKISREEIPSEDKTSSFTMRANQIVNKHQTGHKQTPYTMKRAMTIKFKNQNSTG